MEAPFNNILVFKTNIKTEADRQSVKPLLDSYACIRQWNVDLHDVDCVLRIVLRQAQDDLRQAQDDLRPFDELRAGQDDRRSLTIPETIALITRHGYECSELL